MYEHLGRRQETLYSRISQSSNMFAVRYCFGGMAIYNAHIWTDTECAYTRTPRTYATLSGSFCEHLALQQCLDRNIPLRVGIAPYSHVKRS